MDKKISEKPSISGGAIGVIHVGSHPAGVTKKGHPLKGTCQEKKIIHQQEIAFFSWERGGCENGPPSGSSEQPPTL